MIVHPRSLHNINLNEMLPGVPYYIIDNERYSQEQDIAIIRRAIRNAFRKLLKELPPNAIVIPFVGYTSAGKTTTINELIGRLTCNIPTGPEAGTTQVPLLIKWIDIDVPVPVLVDSDSDADAGTDNEIGSVDVVNSEHNPLDDENSNHENRPVYLLDCGGVGSDPANAEYGTISDLLTTLETFVKGCVFCCKPDNYNSREFKDILRSLPQDFKYLIAFNVTRPRLDNRGYINPLAEVQSGGNDVESIAFCQEEFEWRKRQSYPNSVQFLPNIQMTRAALSVYRLFLEQEIEADLITYSALEYEDDSYYSIKYLRQGLVNFLKCNYPILEVEYAKKSSERNQRKARLNTEISKMRDRIEELERRKNRAQRFFFGYSGAALGFGAVMDMVAATMSVGSAGSVAVIGGAILAIQVLAGSIAIRSQREKNAKTREKEEKQNERETLRQQDEQDSQRVTREFRNFDPETIYRRILETARTREFQRQNQPNRNQVISRDLRRMKVYYKKDLAWLYKARLESERAIEELESLESESIEDLDEDERISISQMIFDSKVARVLQNICRGEMQESSEELRSLESRSDLDDIQRETLSGLRREWDDRFSNNTEN